MASTQPEHEPAVSQLALPSSSSSSSIATVSSSSTCQSIIHIPATPSPPRHDTPVSDLPGSDLPWYMTTPSPKLFQNTAANLRALKAERQAAGGAVSSNSTAHETSQAIASGLDLRSRVTRRPARPPPLGDGKSRTSNRARRLLMGGRKTPAQRRKATKAIEDAIKDMASKDDWMASPEEARCAQMEYKASRDGAQGFNQAAARFENTVIPGQGAQAAASSRSRARPRAQMAPAEAASGSSSHSEQPEEAPRLASAPKATSRKRKSPAAASSVAHTAPPAPKRAKKAITVPTALKKDPTEAAEAVETSAAPTAARQPTAKTNGEHAAAERILANPRRVVITDVTRMCVLCQRRWLNREAEKTAEKASKPDDPTKPQERFLFGPGGCVMPPPAAGGRSKCACCTRGKEKCEFGAGHVLVQLAAEFTVPPPPPETSAGITIAAGPAAAITQEPTPADTSPEVSEEELAEAGKRLARRR